MADPFDSAWLKWGWAVAHAQALERDISAYTLDTKVDLPYTTRTEYDAKRHAVLLRVETIDPLPIRWGLRIGDVANNFRAALDHLAWALVQRGRNAGKLTQAQKRNIYFPIAFSRTDFNSALGKLPGIRRADRAIIRRYQPYLRGKSNVWRHCLTPLPRLTADDKHKEIRPVWSVPLKGMDRPDHSSRPRPDMGVWRSACRTRLARDHPGRRIADARPPDEASGSRSVRASTEKGYFSV
jgi:hypothetical protein